MLLPQAGYALISGWSQRQDHWKKRLHEVRLGKHVFSSKHHAGPHSWHKLWAFSILGDHCYVLWCQTLFPPLLSYFSHCIFTHREKGESKMRILSLFRLRALLVGESGIWHYKAKTNGHCIATSTSSDPAAICYYWRWRAWLRRDISWSLPCWGLLWAWLSVSSLLPMMCGLCSICSDSRWF